MPSLADMLAGVAITLGFLVIIACAELWRHFGGAAAEHTRRLVHVAGGIVCLLLPLTIQSHWVVLAMAVGMLLLFIAGRYTGMLQSLHGVDRRTWGVEYYPPAIFLLYCLAHDTPWKYVICILVLAVSDAMAGLVGARYGRIRYQVDDEPRSLEGSFAFFAVTLLVVLLPLVFWPDPAIPEVTTCILAALLVATLATGFEAVSLGGSDNLWVPFGTYVVLTNVLGRPLSEVVTLNVSLAAICLVIGLAAWRTRVFNVGGTLVFILYAYAVWSLGSFCWAFPIFLGLIVYVAAYYFAGKPRQAMARPLMGLLLPPFLVLVGANVAYPHYGRAGFDWLYGPYLAGCVSVVIQSIWTQILHGKKIDRRLRPFYVTATAGAVWCVVAVPAWAVQHDVAIAAVLLVAAACIAESLLYDRLMAARLADGSRRQRYTVRVLLITAVMAIVATVQATGIVRPWNPW